MKSNFTLFSLLLCFIVPGNTRIEETCYSYHMICLPAKPGTCSPADAIAFSDLVVFLGRIYFAGPNRRSQHKMAAHNVIQQWKMLILKL